MREGPGGCAGLPLVDVLVSLPAGSRLDAAPLGGGPAPAACLALHRVEWRATEPAADGRRVWRFRAPDAESVRIALRCLDIPYDAVRVLDGIMKS